jgi:MscS family membrane protein
MNRILKNLATLVMTAIITLAPVWCPGALRARPALSGVEGLSPSSQRFIPIAQQPFYPDLLATSHYLNEAALDPAVGDSPRTTLLDFYARMAKVYHEINKIESEISRKPQLRWTVEQKKRIQGLTSDFEASVQSLNSSRFPASVRSDLAQEGALQLKQVLDYIFGTSIRTIAIPDAAEMKAIIDRRSKSSGDWTLPGSAITLTNEDLENPGKIDYLFSPDTVADIGSMFDEIRGIGLPIQPFATPGFYEHVAHTPGHLIPPLWYLDIPRSIRQVLEVSLWDQSLLQIAVASLAALAYIVIVLRILNLIIGTFRYRESADSGVEGLTRRWVKDSVGWYRALLALSVLPLTLVVRWFVDDYVNLTGALLVVKVYLFEVILFAACAATTYFLFEALGHGLAEWILKRNNAIRSDLRLTRITNLTLPGSRILASLVIVAFLYTLLIRIGLPASSVLAFSAVPGLAVGLGASKLLGNVFAALSIQTDRPLRVGEFCGIGPHMGYVRRIGLRSLLLETQDSRITIPNSEVDAATIRNYSHRDTKPGESLTQTMDIRMPIEVNFSPDQCRDLLGYAKRELQLIDSLSDIVVNLELVDSGQMNLNCIASLEQRSWPDYLELRQSVILRLKELVDQTLKCHTIIQVSYATSSAQLEHIPDIMREVVEQDPSLTFRAGRLVRISDYSYDFSMHYVSAHREYGKFKDAAAAVNRRLLAAFDLNHIEIPYPTALELRQAYKRD